MTCYPLGIAGLLAVACDCMRRGDLEGAQSALARATDLARDDRSATADRDASHAAPAAHGPRRNA